MVSSYHKEGPDVGLVSSTSSLQSIFSTIQSSIGGICTSPPASGCHPSSQGTPLPGATFPGPEEEFRQKEGYLRPIDPESINQLSILQDDHSTRRLGGFAIQRLGGVNRLQGRILAYPDSSIFSKVLRVQDRGQKVCDQPGDPGFYSKGDF